MKHDLDKISKWLAIAISIVPIIILGVFLVIFTNDIIISGTLCLVFGMLSIDYNMFFDMESGNLDVRIYRFLKPRISMETYLKSGFSYKETISLVSCDDVYVKTIWIDDEEIPVKNSLMTIAELVDLMNHGTTFSFQVTETSGISNMKLPLTRNDLESLLEDKESNARLRDYKWYFPYQRKCITVWNNLLPGFGFAFLNVNNDPHLLDRVKTISPQRLMDVILNNSYSCCQVIPTSVFSDEFDDLDIARMDCVMDAKNGQPLYFTCMQKEKQEDVKDEIDVSSIKNENKQINLDRLKTTAIGKLISEIDTQIQKGYVFENISIDRYKDGYRKECMDILSSPYNMSQEQETKILTILQTLRNNMYDKKEKQHTLDTDVSIKAMEELLKYDGIINNLKM